MAWLRLTTKDEGAELWVNFAHVQLMWREKVPDHAGTGLYLRSHTKYVRETPEEIADRLAARAAEEDA